MEGEMKEKLLMRGSETQRLIEAQENSSSGNVDDDEEVSVSLKEAIWKESKKMWMVAAPAIFTRMTTFGIAVITQALVGHIDSTELAAFALVMTVLVRFANGILLGMSGALQTFCGQSYGARQYHMLGLHLQRSWIVLFFGSVCLLPLFIFTAPILKFLGQEDKISEMAGHVGLWFIPVMFAYGVSFSCQTFLQSQSKNVIISYLAALSVVLHLIFSWLLTVKYKLGIQGAMTSTILAYWIPNVGQLLFILCGGCKETWKGFTSLAFKDLWLVVKLSVSSGVMLCLEFWYNTVLILLTGNLRNAVVSIDALSICVLTSFSIGLVLFLVFLFLRGSVAYIFTDSEEVAKAIADLSSLLALSLLLNSVQPVLSGVALGAGWQSSVAYVNLTCYYLIGIPIGLLLGYVLNMQLKGVWIGMLFGTLVQTIVLTVLTCKTDWDKQVTLARNRVNKWLVADAEEPTPSKT